MMVVSLAFADILNGLLTPFNILGWLNIGGNEVCLTETIISLQATGASIISIMLISIDRYLSVSKPLRYRIMISRTKVGIAIMITWLSSFLCVLLCTFLGGSWDETIVRCTWTTVLTPAVFYGVLLSLYSICALVSFVLYLLILYIAWNRTRRISSPSFELVIHKRQTKLSKMMAINMILFHILYLPATILEPFAMSGNLVIFSFYYLSRVLWFSKAMINPIIYGWLNKDFRNAYKKLLRIKHSNKISVSN